jgi:pimeloyl-ACP methyl ester carboxylesterase
MTPTLRVAALLCLALLLPPSAARADGPTSHTFTAKGVKLHYLSAGKGETVVLIHGLHSSAEINWKLTGVVGELAKTHRVLALDLPGHGRSEKPKNDSAYGLQVVDDVALLLDELKIKKAHVVGYSLGGMVTMKFLTKYPDRVLSATVGGMGWFREGGFIQKIWEKMPTRDSDFTPPAFIRNVGKLAVSEKELKKIDVPVKIIVGDSDVCKPLYVAPLQKVRKDWPVAEIEKAGHFDCIIKKPFRDEIVTWVKKNSKS